MIRGGHDEEMEGTIGLIDIVCCAQGPAIQIFVAGSPDIGKGDILPAHTAAVNNMVAIMAEIIVHVIEITVTTINKGGIVSLGPKQRTQGKGALRYSGASRGICPVSVEWIKSGLPCRDRYVFRLHRNYQRPGCGIPEPTSSESSRRNVRIGQEILRLGSRR